LSKSDKIELPAERPNGRSSWHLYPIRLKSKNKRKAVFDYLRKNNIGVQVHYIPVYLHPYYRTLGYKKGLCPIAEDFYQREISIPIYQSMKKSDVRRVIDKVSNALNNI
jgi:dTDP-4-amino-4,6-dideoxygalactose transaminase